MAEKTLFERLASIDCSHLSEKRVVGGKSATYLSWAPAWGLFVKQVPDATYQTLPYEVNEFGIMVHTTVTAERITREMWLPVLDGANKPMKSTGYDIVSKYGTKHIEAANMFDINTAQMRCLVKNLAMFGLGIYIYAGEDLPMEKNEESRENTNNAKTQVVTPTLTSDVIMTKEEILQLYALKKPNIPASVAKSIDEVLLSGDESRIDGMVKYLQGV